MTFGWILAFFSAAMLFVGWVLLSIARRQLALRRAASRLKVLEGTVSAVHESAHGGMLVSRGHSTTQEQRGHYSIDVRFRTPAGEEATFRGATSTPYRPSVGDPIDVLFDPLGVVPPALKRDLGASPGFSFALGLLCVSLALLLAGAAWGVLSGRLQTGG